MKKTLISLSIVLLVFCLSGCNSNNDKATIKNGTYILEQIGTEYNNLACVTISDDDLSFSYDLLSSYLPYGNYTIKNDILTMTTADDKYKYVFKIDGDSLFFQKNESSSVNLTDNKFGVKIENNAEFILIDQ